MSVDTDLATLWAPVIWGQAQTDALKRLETALRDKDAEIARLRENVPELERMIHGNFVAAENWRTHANKLEAEIERLREERDGLAEAQQFPVETVMSWKRRAERAERMNRYARALLDPERQDEPNEENALRAYEALSGVPLSVEAGLPSAIRRAEAAEARAEAAEAEVERLRSDKDERDWRTLEIVTKQAEAAEARCARLQQALREMESAALKAAQLLPMTLSTSVEADHRSDHPSWAGWLLRHKVLHIARAALAGPGTREGK